MSRREVAMRRLAYLRAAWPEHPEYVAQRKDDWLEIATGGEVRRFWRPWMGRMPAWAVRS